MIIYHIIYKTTHKNGKFYIGRHSTKNLDDGYLGSGKWVKSIKDKSNLSREIITEASSIEELYELEEYYINIYFDDPLCMNYGKGARGWTSESVSQFNLQIQENGKSRSQNRAKNLYDSGRSGLVSDDGENIVYKLTREQKNPFFKREDGSSVASDRVKNGNHNLKGGVTCVNINGEVQQIPKEEYRNQTGKKNEWKWVCVASKEGKRRLGITPTKTNFVGNVSCYDLQGNVVSVPKQEYHSQTGPIKTRQFAFNKSKEGQRRKLLQSK